MAEAPLTSTPLIEGSKKIAEGKVRNLYKVDSNTLLFVATDRISAYDVIMDNGVPSKGTLLTLMSAHWFKVLPTLIPNLRTHFLTLDLPSSIPESQRSLFRNRSMQVRRLEVLPLEAIVRGYITGSAWKEYQRTGTVHGIQVDAGLEECEAFPKGPIFTPSTKAEAGQNDENIHPDEVTKRTGISPEHALRVEKLALELYTTAHAYAKERGIIIADTKFEFGLDKETDEIILIDEVLTPDSSRFWPADQYEIGHDQESFDKQYLRNWLTKTGKKGVQNVSMDDAVVAETAKKYQEAFEKLTGMKWVDAIRG